METTKWAGDGADQGIDASPAHRTCALDDRINLTNYVTQISMTGPPTISLLFHDI